MTVERGQEQPLRYFQEMDRMVKGMDVPELLSAAILHTADAYSRHVPSIGCSVEEIRKAMLAREKYTEKFIEKRRGGKRRLLIPDPGLAVVQDKLYKWIKYTWPSFTDLKEAPEYKLYGFGYRYSYGETGGYVDYALCHKDSNWFFQFDLKDAFPSVDIERLKKVLFLRFQQGMLLEIWQTGGRFRFYPALKNQRKIQELIDLIINLFTYDGALPQGPSSSPFLFFLYLMEDPIIKFPSNTVRTPRGIWPCLIERVPPQWQVSGYYDNVCISGKKRVPDWLKESVIEEFRRAGFVAHKIEETNIRHGSPMLCGLRISDAHGVRRIVLPKKEVRRIRAMIWKWKYSRGLSLARRIKGTVDNLRQIYGPFENFPSQILDPLNEVGWYNIIRVASR